MFQLQRICKSVHGLIEIEFVLACIVCSVNGANAEPVGIELSVNFLETSEFLVDGFAGFVNVGFIAVATDHGILIILKFSA